MLEENWAIVEPRLRAVIFDEVTWKLEVEAEWATAKGAVYKKEIVDLAVERSRVSATYFTREAIFSTLQYDRCPKFLGVDWNNPQNGVRLVETAELNLTGSPNYWVTRNEIISYETYTQTRAVERIMKLYDEHLYRKIAVDSGYGEFQIERITQELVKRGINPNSVLHVVDCNAGAEEIDIEYISPVYGHATKETLKIRMKDRIVNLLTTYLESVLVLFKEDDIDKTSIVTEIRNFLRKETSIRGGFIYSDKTHSLSALQINVHGIEQYKKDGHMEVDKIEIFKSESIGKMVGLTLDNTIAHNSFASLQYKPTRMTGIANGRERRSIL
jgi:hypothetical protein